MPTADGQPRTRDRGPRVGSSQEQENRTVKRTVAILAGAAALSLAVFVVGRLVAQQPAAPPPLRTRVGLVNLPHVIKSYNKYLAFEREWNEQYKTFEKQFDSKRALLVQY